MWVKYSMPKAAEDRVPCRSETKDRLRAAKTGGETYDHLFRSMLDQYDPDSAPAPGARGGA